jgi:uncharacterized membrane protein YczE
MTRRDAWRMGAVILVAAVGFGLWRSAHGADTGTAVWSGLWVVLVTTSGLTVNQLAARRRARRRTPRR